MQTIPDFIKRTREVRASGSLQNFKAEIGNLERLNLIVDTIHKNSVKWGTRVGIVGKITEAAVETPDQEKIWKLYFSDHTFRTMEEAKNIVDLVSLLTGLDVSKYLPTTVQKVPETGSRFFPAYISVIPTGNTNGHDYPLGEPILSFGVSPIFIMSSGETGNNMTTILKHISIPTRDQIKELVLRVMYNNVAITERNLADLGS